MTECKHRWEQVWDGAYSCARCNDYIYTNKPNTLTWEGAGISSATIKPSYMLTFHNDKYERVGAFDFNEGKMHFEGDVTESEKIFVDWVVAAFKGRIDDAVAAEREACHALRQTLINPHQGCQVSAHAYDMAVVAYGAAIRARSKQ